MQTTVAEAVKNGVSIGAHPSYPDLQGFGRRPMTMDAREVEALMAYQIGALMGVAATRGAKVTHVKPHGAINNKAAVDADLAAPSRPATKAVPKAWFFSPRAAPRLTGPDAKPTHPLPTGASHPPTSNNTATPGPPAP